jgi:hypothetical protein
MGQTRTRSTLGAMAASAKTEGRVVILELENVSKIVGAETHFYPLFLSLICIH